MIRSKKPDMILLNLDMIPELCNLAYVKTLHKLFFKTIQQPICVNMMLIHINYYWR